MSQDFDEWNPREEAFQDRDFNSYDRGPGKYIGSTNYKNENIVRLYISNIPQHINEDGLRALFSKTGVVRNVWRQLEHNFAFVTMASLRDAESAIRQLHGKTIEKCRIGVRVAKNENEKALLLQQKKDEEEFYKKLRFGNRHSKDEDWNADDYPSFSAVDPPPKNVCQNGADGDASLASSKKSSPMDEIIQSVHNVILSRNKKTVFDHLEQSNQQESASKKSVNKTNVGNISKKQLNPCKKCGKPGTKRCSQCKSPYCSIECQQQDWFENHHIECINIYLQNASLDELAERFDINLNTDAFLHSSTDNKPLKLEECSVLADHKSASSKETSSKRNQRRFKKDELEKMPSKPKSQRDSSSSQSSQSDVSPRKPSDSKRKTSNRSRESPKAIPAKELEIPSNDLEKPQKPNLINPQKSPSNSTFQTEPDHKKLNVPKNPMKITSKLQLPLHKLCQVMVTNVASSEEIHVQLIEETNVRTTTYLVTELAKVYGVNSKEFPCISSPRVGEIYACCFSADKFWYRAQIVNMNGSDITVKYIDYGNTEITSCDMMRALIPQLKEIPQQVVCCALDISPPKTREDINLVVKQEIRYDRPYRLKVIRTGQPYIIELYDEHGDVGKKLTKLINSKIHLEHSVLKPSKAIPKISSSVILVSDMKNRSDLLKIGTRYSILPFNVISPDDFMVQVVILDQDFHKFNQKLQTCALSCPFLLEKPVPNQLVFVQNPQGQWCRAEVMQINKDSRLTVRLLDHGSIDIVSLQNVRSSLPLCCDHPFITVRSKLAEIKPVDKQGWSPKLCNIFKETLEAMNDSVRVKDQHILGEYNGFDNNGRHLWKLIDLCTDASIADLLVLDGHAILTNPTSYVMKPLESCKIMVSDIPKIPLAVGSLHNGVAIDFQSDKFFINIIQPDQKEFQMNLNKVLNAAEDEGTHYIACENEIVAAKFSVDNSWYRGQITKVFDELMFTVFFIDYGNSECLPADQLRPLPKQFASYAKQAIHCKLHNALIPEDGLLQFAKLVFNTIYKYKIVSEKNEIFSVIVSSSDGECLNDLFKEVNTNGYLSENDIPKSNSLTCHSLPGFSTGSPPGVPSSSSRTSSLSIESSTAMSHAVQQISPIQSALIPNESSLHKTLLNEQKLSTLSLESRADSDFVSRVNSPKVKYYTKNMSCLLLETNNCYKLHCTSVVGVDNFYCQLLDDTAILQYFELMEELAKVCNELSEEPTFFPEKGQLIAAKFLDDWYRAKVIDSRDNKVEVFFVDYGNVSLVAKEQLREICSEIFVEFPILAVRCCLTGISQKKWLNEISKFQDQTLNVKVVGKVGNTYQIILEEDLEEHVEEKSVCFSPPPPPCKPADNAEKERIQRQIEELQRKLASYN